MLAAERRAQILQAAQRDGVVRVAEIAAELRVSDATVRRDLESLAQAGLVDKVHGGATPRAEDTIVGTAVTPEPELLAHIGVLAPGVTYYFRRVVAGIQAASEVTSTACKLNLMLSDGVISSERRLIEGLLASGVEGLLLSPSLGPGGRNSAYEDWIRQLPVPIVLVERELSGNALNSVSSVRTAHERGAIAAVEHLHELGHSRVGLVIRGDSQTAMLVRAGWQSAVETLGLAPDVPVIIGRDIDSWPRWSAEDLDGVLEKFSTAGITAILCHNDEDALTIVQHSQTRGWKIPDDLSVVAYDDELASMSHPPLTAVAPPKERIGARALATILDHLGADNLVPAERLHLDPTLVIRSSTTSFS